MKKTETVLNRGDQAGMFVSLSHISELEVGDIIQSKLDGKGYVVTGNYGNFAIAVKQMYISNPSEWLKFSK